jgi:hypothetical protein
MKPYLELRGMAFVGRLLAGVALTLVIAGCGAVARTPGGAHSASATASASPSGDAVTSPSADTSASPSTDATPAASTSPSTSTCAGNPLCVWRPATAQEEAAMIAVGRPAAERDLGLKDGSSCSGTDNCFWVGNPSRAAVGSEAGIFYGTTGSASGTGGGAGCTVFLYHDATGWHYVNARCAQATGYMPGIQDRVWVSGCANVRETPGLSGRILACLPNQTVVDVDSAPVYRDGHIWWHLAGRGWMAHDFLVAPKSAP